MSMIENYSEAEKNLEKMSVEKISIDSLDDNGLKKIFKYLSITDRLEAEKVCSRWKNIIDSIWHDFKEFKFEKYSFNKLPNIEKILSRVGEYLTHLSLFGLCCSSIMPVIRDECYNLIDLKFEYGKYDATDFTDAFKNMNNLKRIHIRFPEPKFLNNILICIPKKIHEINILPYHTRPKRWPLHSSHELISIFQRFQSLYRFSLQYCLLDHDTLKAISGLTNLISLDLRNCRFKEGETKDGILLSKLVNLENLNLGFVTKVNTNLHHRHEDLQYESLNDNDGFILKSIGEKCNNMKSLNLSCTDFGKSYSEISNFEKLEYLNLEYAYSLCDESLIKILEKCTSIKHLDMGLYSSSEYKSYLSSSTLKKIANLKNLEHLDIQSRKNVDDSVIKNIVKFCTNLKQLNLEGCKKISKTVLKDINELENLKITPGRFKRTF